MRKTSCLAACLLLVLALSGCGQQKIGQDTPYPYTWKETRTGGITVRITGQADGVWKAENYASDILTAAVEQTEASGKATVTLTPQASGTTEVTLSCQEQVGGFSSQRFAIRLTVQVDQTLHAAVLDHTEQEGETVTMAAADTSYPCAVKTEDDGSLSLYVSDTAGGSWDASADSENFSVSAPFYDAEGCLYTVYADGAGTGTVQLQRTYTGETIRLPVTADDSGRITADSSQAEVFTEEVTTEDS